jgi:hypothetical protein
MAVFSSAAAAIAFLSWRTLERERIVGVVIGRSAHGGTPLVVDMSSGRGERTKGAASFELYIRHGEGIRMAADREVAHPGDQLQFAYSSERSGHVAVLSRDGAGVASVYFPDRAETWVAAPGQGRLLPQSTILDATLGREQLYALFCSARVALEPALRALSEGRPPSIEGCSVRNIELEKIP